VQTTDIDISVLLEEAQGLRRGGALADAAHRYRRVLLLDPLNVDALYYLAQISCQLGDVNGGVALVRRAIVVNPQQGRLHNLLGMALAALGRPHEALASFDTAIMVAPQLISAYGARGDALVTLGRFEEAIENYDHVLESDPTAVDTWCNRGAALQQIGLSARAHECYERAVTLCPDIIEAAIGQGVALLSMARHREALAAFESVLARDPRNIEALGGCGFVLNALDRPADALSICDKVLSIRPDHIGALNNRGTAFCLLGRHEEGLASYRRVVELEPQNVESLANCAYALNSLGRSLEALESCDQALAVRPGFIAALNHRGIALMVLRRLDEAQAMFDSVLAIDPDEIDALNNRSGVLFSFNRFEEALAGYDAVLRLAPGHVDALYNRGMSLYIMNRGVEAVDCFEQTIVLRPSYGKARIGRCIAQLPIIYSDAVEIATRRAAYERMLSMLRNDVERDDIGGALADAVGAMQPFYLSYQGRNDRDLQRLYGEMVCRALARKYPPAESSPAPGQGHPVRVGIVSGFFFQHSVWKCLLKGWMSQIDRNRFRLFGYYTASTRDPETDAAKSLCEKFIQGPLPVERWRETILADAIHVLIYPEIGMDPVCPQLAGQRLASVQCNSWGHPETSGFPTLDYFLSSDLMEPPDGQDHYTERLIRLPNLSGFYEPAETSLVSETRIGLDFGFDLGLNLGPAVIKYWSPQSLYKYLPQFDWIFPRIAGAVGPCRFVFIQDKSADVSETFRKRLDRAFAAANMNAADYCLILPRLDQTRFGAAMRSCDIFLDNPEWSGCTTSLESLQFDLPIVTMSGRLMRGRHTAAFLRMMNVHDTIADSVDEYVTIATRLALDESWRTKIRERIRMNKNRIYRDHNCIKGLESFLDRVARNSVS